MSAVLACECGNKPRYRLTIWRIGTMDDALGNVEVCDMCMEGIALLQPRVAKIIADKRRERDQK